MPRMKSARIQDHFVDLTDPRRREVVYPLTNVVVIAVCAVTRRRNRRIRLKPQTDRPG